MPQDIALGAVAQQGRACLVIGAQKRPHGSTAIWTDECAPHPNEHRKQCGGSPNEPNAASDLLPRSIRYVADYAQEQEKAANDDGNYRGALAVVEFAGTLDDGHAG